MKPYQYYCDLVGLDSLAYKKQPEIKHTYVIYVNQQAKEVSLDLYREHKGAKEIVKDATLHEAFWKAQDAIRQQSTDLWYNDLKAEYGVSDKLFDLCYNMAYDRGHSSGYDEVAMHMHEIVDFAEKVLALQKT